MEPAEHPSKCWEWDLRTHGWALVVHFHVHSAVRLQLQASFCLRSYGPMTMVQSPLGGLGLRVSVGPVVQGAASGVIDLLVDYVPIAPGV